jgi:hypothetical protein
MQRSNIAKVSWGFVGAYLVLTFIYRISTYIGSGSSTECGYAMAVVIISWLISMLPYIFVDKRKFNAFIAVFMTGSAIRIFLTCGFVLVILKTRELREPVLLSWSAVFYFMFLGVDTYFNMKYLKEHDWNKKDFFADKENEIYINNS